MSFCDREERAFLRDIEKLIRRRIDVEEHDLPKPEAGVAAAYAAGYERSGASESGARPHPAPRNAAQQGRGRPPRDPGRSDRSGEGRGPAPGRSARGRRPDRGRRPEPAFSRG